MEELRECEVWAQVDYAFGEVGYAWRKGYFHKLTDGEWPKAVVELETGKVVFIAMDNFRFTKPNSINKFDVEAHADLEHEIWSHWMYWLFTNGQMKESGSFVIHRDAVERWMRQLGTEYCDLSEEEKQKDRDQAQKHLDLLKGLPIKRLERV